MKPRQVRESDGRFDRFGARSVALIGVSMIVWIHAQAAYVNGGSASIRA
jgi:hypothetical protein